MTTGVEPKLRDIRRARGVATAPCRRPRNPSTRHPPLPNPRPCSPQPAEPDVTTRSTRSRSVGPAAASCVATDGADSCRASRQRACLRSTPCLGRGRSHEPHTSHHDDVHTRYRTQEPVLLSKRSHLPILLDHPNRSCRRRRRRARPLEFALHRQYRTEIARRSDLHRAGANSNEAAADTGRNPRLPSKPKPQSCPERLQTSPSGVATARLHGFSRSSIAPGPAVRANPSGELQCHMGAELERCQQRPHRCRHRHSRHEAPAEPKIHRSNTTSHEISQRFASRLSETPYHQTVAETLPSYLARSTRRPKP